MNLKHPYSIQQQVGVFFHRYDEADQALWRLTPKLNATHVTRVKVSKSRAGGSGQVGYRGACVDQAPDLKSVSDF